MKILVVEDEPAGRKLIALMLQGEHEVFAVAGVDEAVSQLADGKWDVLLTDYKMPGRTGGDLIESLAAGTCTMPIIMMTGQSSHDAGLTAIRNKANKFLIKPFSRTDLIAAIAEVTRASQEAPEDRSGG